MELAELMHSHQESMKAAQQEAEARRGRGSILGLQRLGKNQWFDSGKATSTNKNTSLNLVGYDRCKHIPPKKGWWGESVAGKNVDAKLGGFCLDKFIFPLDFSGCFFFQKLAPLKPRFGLRTQDGAETGAQTAWQDNVVASVLWSASPVGAWDAVGLCWSTMINWAWEGSLVWMWRWNLLNPESPFLGWVLDMIFGSNWRSSDDKLVKHTPEVEMWSELHMKRHCKLWQDRELSQTEPSTPQKDSQKDSKGRGSLTIHFIFGLISWCMTGFHVVLRRV